MVFRLKTFFSFCKIFLWGWTKFQLPVWTRRCLVKLLLLLKFLSHIAHAFGFCSESILIITIFGRISFLVICNIYFCITTENLSRTKISLTSVCPKMSGQMAISLENFVASVTFKRPLVWNLPFWADFLVQGFDKFPVWEMNESRMSPKMIEWLITCKHLGDSNL